MGLKVEQKWKLRWPAANLLSMSSVFYGYIKIISIYVYAN